jgi:hypothetical protein
VIGFFVILDILDTLFGEVIFISPRVIMLLGVPEAAIKCQAKALCAMRYAVKHVHGTASQKYTGSVAVAEPRYGTG